MTYFSICGLMNKVLRCRRYQQRVRFCSSNSKSEIENKPVDVVIQKQKPCSFIDRLIDNTAFITRVIIIAPIVTHIAGCLLLAIGFVCMRIIELVVGDEIYTRLKKLCPFSK